MSDGGNMNYTTRTKLFTGRKIGKYPVMVVATRVPTVMRAMLDAELREVRVHGHVRPGTPHMVASVMTEALISDSSIVTPI